MSNAFGVECRPIYTLVYLFVGGVELPCEDSDNNGGLDITDAVLTFSYFSSGPSLRESFDAGGIDVSEN